MSSVLLEFFGFLLNNFWPTSNLHVCLGHNFQQCLWNLHHMQSYQLGWINYACFVWKQMNALAADFALGEICGNSTWLSKSNQRITYIVITNSHSHLQCDVHDALLAWLNAFLSEQGCSAATNIINCYVQWVTCNYGDTEAHYYAIIAHF